ncbi:calcium-binding protein [Roseobacter weihaiensis]|uniref:calcium-binding protein n=1 Tax=Roseobacter weihaiensis TaxID=2763262 RepID=UPI001D0A5CC8|nr:hypothetical protein [Roseobacter sp. H9]
MLIATPDGEIELAGQVRYEVSDARSNIETILFNEATLDEAEIKARAMADQAATEDDILVGSSGDDTLDGGAGDDTLRGGAGNDMLTGGSGLDYFTVASGDGHDVIQDFEIGQDKIVVLGEVFEVTVTPTVNGALIAIDPETSVELRGIDPSQVISEMFETDSNVALTIVVSEIIDEVTGTEADDRIDTSYVDLTDGDVVNDSGQIIVAGGGSDHIYDGAGDDEVYGGDGNDRLYSGGGADLLDGGAETDWVIYSRSTVGIVIDLTDTSNSTGIASGDTYQSISQVDGTAHGDRIIMDGSIQNINAKAGDDTIVDLGGGTHLWGVIRSGYF